MQPSPSFAVCNIGHGGSRQTELFSDADMAQTFGTEPANFTNLIFGYAHHRISFATKTSAVSDHIGAVCFAGVVSKITNHVIGRIPVSVANFGAIWPRADKCEHHKFMHKTLGFSAQMDRLTPKFVYAVFKHPSSAKHNAFRTVGQKPIQRPNAPQIRRFVEFVPGYGLPDFLHSVPHAQSLTIEGSWLARVRTGVRALTLAKKPYYTAGSVSWQ